MVRNSAENLASTSLELGGKSPFVVFADADLESAANAQVAGIFAATGQSCVAGSRLIVEASVKDQFLALLKAKAEAVAKLRPDALVLAADTVVGLGRRILPKAETPAEVAQCLGLLSGRRHTVVTGLCLIHPDGRRVSRAVETKVRFRRLEAAEIAAYAAGGEGLGKAGGYAIQGFAGTFVHKIAGSYSAVVGLPLFETVQLLNGGAAWATRFRAIRFFHKNRYN